jgi:hypothetical protein
MIMNIFHEFHDMNEYSYFGLLQGSHTEQDLMSLRLLKADRFTRKGKRIILISYFSAYIR